MSLKDILIRIGILPVAILIDIIILIIISFLFFTVNITVYDAIIPAEVDINVIDYYAE